MYVAEEFLVNIFAYYDTNLVDTHGEMLCIMTIKYPEMEPHVNRF
jgi:hypothetical protein